MRFPGMHRAHWSSTQHLLQATALLVCLLMSAPLASQGLYGFLKDSPAGNFDKKDWELMRGALSDVLEQDATSGEKIDWRNPDTGHSGKITALKVFRAEDGRDCKRLLIENNAGGRSSANKFNACRHEDGSWREMESGAPLTSAQ